MEPLEVTMEGVDGKEVCAFCGVFIIESGRRQFLENFNSEFIVPFCVSVFGGDGRVLLGGKEVPDNWSVCGKCLPGVRGVLGLKEKVDLMESEVRELQREILRRMNLLLEEVERMCEGMGVVWRMMPEEGEEEGEVLRRRFRNLVGNVLLDLQSFRDESSEKLQKKSSNSLYSTKSSKTTKSQPPTIQEDSNVIMEIDLISDTESQGSENDVRSQLLSPPAHNSPLDSNFNEEADQISGDLGDFKPEAEEQHTSLHSDVREEKRSEDETSEEEEEDSSSEDSESDDSDEESSSENDDGPNDGQKNSNANAFYKDNPQLRQRIKEYRRRKRHLRVNVCQRLITKITETQSIATSLDLPSSPPDDPRRNYCIQYNPEQKTFHLSGIEIKYLDDRNGFQCTVCNVICRSTQRRHAEEIIFDHILGMHLNAYKCPYCEGPHFRNHGFFYAHIWGAHKERLLTCDICGKRVKDTYALKSHKWSHLSQEEREDPTNCHMKPSRLLKPTKRPPPKPCLCPQCGKQLTSASLYEHLKTHDEDRRKLKCPDCGRAYLGRQGYRIHRKNGCKISKEKVGPPCPVCGDPFQSRKLMFQHLRHAHPQERLYPCDICGMRFRTEPDMVYHKKKHLQNNDNMCKHVCENCGAALKTKKSLKYHKKVTCGKVKVKKKPDMSKMWEKKLQEPVDVRPFACGVGVCNKRFTAKTRLYHHRRTEHFSEGLKHRCDSCGRGFVHPANLRKHLKKCGALKMRGAT